MTFTFDIMKVEGTSDSIYESLVVQIILFLSNLTLKLHIKCQNLGALSEWEMGCYATRRDIYC